MADSLKILGCRIKFNGLLFPSYRTSLKVSKEQAEGSFINFFQRQKHLALRFVLNFTSHLTWAIWTSRYLKNSWHRLRKWDGLWGGFGLLWLGRGIKEGLSNEGLRLTAAFRIITKKTKNKGMLCR